MIASNCKSNIDIIIDKLIFLNNKFNGTFIECGANDGKNDSISYYFEKNYGWSGYLIEPQAELMERCKKVRSSSNIFIQKGLGNKNQKLEMTIPTDNVDNASFSLSDAHIDELHRLGYGAEFKKETIDVISYLTLIKKYNIKNIDLAIFDVEGYENKILKSMMNSDILPDVLVVETDWSDKDELINIVEPKYVIFNIFPHDIVFLRKYEAKETI